MEGRRSFSGRPNEISAKDRGAGRFYGSDSDSEGSTNQSEFFSNYLKETGVDGGQGLGEKRGGTGANSQTNKEEVFRGYDDTTYGGAPGAQRTRGEGNTSAQPYGYYDGDEYDENMPNNDRDDEERKQLCFAILGILLILFVIASIIIGIILLKPNRKRNSGGNNPQSHVEETGAKSASHTEWLTQNHTNGPINQTVTPKKNVMTIPELVNSTCREEATNKPEELLKCQKYCAPQMSRCFGTAPTSINTTSISPIGQKSNVTKKEPPCNDYLPCYMLITDSRHEEDEDIDNSEIVPVVCSKDNIVDNFGYGRCQRICMKRACCFLPPLQKYFCYDETSAPWCDEFIHCMNLLDVTPLFNSSWVDPLRKQDARLLPSTSPKATPLSHSSHDQVDDDKTRG